MGTMKLFQKLLLAPVTIGVLTPMVSSASEVNLNEVSSYTQSSIEINQDSFKPLSLENPLLAGGEGLETNLNDDFETDTFSSTTTLDGKAVFVLGAVDGNLHLQETTSKESVDSNGFVTSSKVEKQSEALSFGYVYQMNLNTSFTGDDNLYVRLKSSDVFENFTSKPGNYHNEAGSHASVVKVDKIWYTLPL